MPLLTILSAILIAASFSNLQTEERDLKEDVFGVTGSYLKGEADAFGDGDKEIDVNDLQRYERFQHYSNETFDTIRHGKITMHRSKRMAQPDDYEDIWNYYARRSNPDSDEEESTTPDDNERKTNPTKCGKRLDNSNRRRNDPQFNNNCEICGKMIGGRRLKTGTLDRVINGRIVKPMNKYPWIVALNRLDEPIFCGGAIISSTFILTASHCLWHPKRGESAQCTKRGGNAPKDCFYKANEITISLLSQRHSEKMKQVKIAQVIPHEQYDSVKILNDIGLLKLAAPLQCNQFSSTICLPLRDFYKFGGNLIVTGWGFNTGEGRSGPKRLREGKMKQIKGGVCKKLTKFFFNKMNDIVCTIGAESKQSSCLGDSGTSIFGEFRNRIYAVGITSRHSDAECKTSMPVTNTKIFPYIKWIKRYVKCIPGEKEER